MQKMMSNRVKNKCKQQKVMRIAMQATEDKNDIQDNENWYESKISS